MRGIARERMAAASAEAPGRAASGLHEAGHRRRPREAPSTSRPVAQHDRTLRVQSTCDRCERRHRPGAPPTARPRRCGDDHVAATDGRRAAARRCARRPARARPTALGRHRLGIGGVVGPHAARTRAGPCPPGRAGARRLEPRDEGREVLRRSGPARATAAAPGARRRRPWRGRIPSPTSCCTTGKVSASASISELTTLLRCTARRAAGSDPFQARRPGRTGRAGSSSAAAKRASVAGPAGRARPCHAPPPPLPQRRGSRRAPASCLGAPGFGQQRGQRRARRCRAPAASAPRPACRRRWHTGPRPLRPPGCRGCRSAAASPAASASRAKPARWTSPTASSGSSRR